MILLMIIYFIPVFDTFIPLDVRSAHNVPRYVEFVAQLPKTLGGQVRRSQLRALELNKAQKQLAKL